MSSVAPNSVPVNGPGNANPNVLNMLFGNQTCVSGWATFGMYVLFAVVAAVLFFLLAHVKVDKYMDGYVKDPNAKLGMKVLLFFLLMLLLIWLFNIWFVNHPTCESK